MDPQPWAQDALCIVVLGQRDFCVTELLLLGEVVRNPANLDPILHNRLYHDEPLTLLFDHRNAEQLREMQSDRDFVQILVLAKYEKLRLVFDLDAECMTAVGSLLLMHTDLLIAFQALPPLDVLCKQIYSVPLLRRGECFVCAGKYVDRSQNGAPRRSSVLPLRWSPALHRACSPEVRARVQLLLLCGAKAASPLSRLERWLLLEIIKIAVF